MDWNWLAKVSTVSMLQGKKIRPSGQLVIFSDYYNFKTKRAKQEGVPGSETTQIEPDFDTHLFSLTHFHCRARSWTCGIPNEEKSTMSDFYSFSCLIIQLLRRVPWKLWLTISWPFYDDL